MPAGRRGGVLVLSAALLALGLAATARAEGVAILGLDGVDLGRWHGHGDLVADDAHCVAVARGHGPPRFRLEATGDGPGGRFELANGVSRLPVVLRYDDGSGARRLEPGRVLDGLRGHPDTPGLRRCLRGDHGARNRLEIRVRERDLAAAGAGEFRGRIFLMVLPE